ncbi:hypothetical protein AND_007862 [Anopheles darlingi]|uniref:Uncharacterized protein n=1 Tax=Anopheles darlingi TaxID=43151 RepID=W5J955_ANODA|nr:uncharacterized protein LOC125949951 [Anopheles darlingi]ETN60516.1 hypothetical protein AND_007862 [Anopheles darlingi]
MSKTLVKKALILAEEALPSSKPQADAKTTKRKASALELIPKHQKLIELVGKKGQRIEKDLIRRRDKVTVSDIRQQLANKHDPTEDNVRRLLLLSSSTCRLDEETRKKILKRAQTGCYVSKVNLSKKARQEQKLKRASSKSKDGAAPAAGESVFTEEDFESFARELEESGI